MAFFAVFENRLIGKANHRIFFSRAAKGVIKGLWGL